MARGKGVRRRGVLKVAAIGAAYVAAQGSGIASLSASPASAQPHARIPLESPTFTKYVDALPIPGVMPPTSPNGTTYQVGMFQVAQKLHSQLPPTTVWGYGTSMTTASYPGATFETTRDVPITVTWTNNLLDSAGKPLSHPLAVDQTLHWADPLHTGPSFERYTGPVPVVTHRHEGEQASGSDGHPEAWFTPGFDIKGEGWVTKTYDYPNDQPPATLWYHDHALGITRLNVYMGLAGFFLIRDPSIEAAFNLPAGKFEIPLVIQDRMFDSNGQLFYPQDGVNPQVHPFWVPEFFGDTIVVNGKVWPFLNVEPRKYRFRLLNGSNARFYNLRLSRGLEFVQIGTDAGYLATPVAIRELLIAPGERADIVVDFTGLKAGTEILLTNDAKAPFPSGSPPNPRTVGQIMQFRVVPLTAPDTSRIPSVLNPIPTLTPTSTRTLTLNEVSGPEGPLGLFLDGRRWGDPVTVTPTLGSTELWELVNLTADTHPIHLHLSSFQVLNRQKFRVEQYLKTYEAANPVIPVPSGAPYTTVSVDPYLVGKPIPAPGNEGGWKDTVRANPGEVTRILVRFAPIEKAAPSPYPFDPVTGPGYVWHCHILEHEDNEMMRPMKFVMK